MSICEWPPGERPREKLIDRGPAALSDAELLAIFLHTGSRGRTAVDLAREQLTAFGNLRKLLAAPVAEFCRQPGLGTARYALLQAALELSRRYLQASLSAGDALTSPDATRQYLSLQLAHHGNEVFAALFLDNQHRIIAWEELFRGSISSAQVHARVLVQRALQVNAAAIILAHNHPSGVAEPSAADRNITRQLKTALDLVEVRLLDHFVIGDGEAVSFAERGLI